MGTSDDRGYWRLGWCSGADHGDLHVNVESAAIARQALEADQVIEVAEPRTEELPAGYASP
jgi:hypothetical protein